MTPKWFSRTAACKADATSLTALSVENLTSIDFLSCLLMRLGIRFIDPISLPTVMSMQSGLIIPSQRRLLRVFWRLFDGLAGKIDEDCRVAPADAGDPL